jgi:hypothetical protein
MAFFHGPTSWSNFHGPISYKIHLQSLWALTRWKPNVNQGEWPCIKKWMWWFFNHLCPKRALWSRGFHRFTVGWMNPSSWRDAPKLERASSLAWHFCQVKPCERVCGERACVRWRLHVLDSPMVEWEMTHCVHLKRELELLLGFDSLPP